VFVRLPVMKFCHTNTHAISPLRFSQATVLSAGVVFFNILRKSPDDEALVPTVANYIPWEPHNIKHHTPCRPSLPPQTPHIPPVAVPNLYCYLLSQRHHPRTHAMLAVSPSHAFVMRRCDIQITPMFSVAGSDSAVTAVTVSYKNHCLPGPMVISVNLQPCNLPRFSHLPGDVDPYCPLLRLQRGTAAHSQ